MISRVCEADIAFCELTTTLFHNSQWDLLSHDLWVSSVCIYMQEGKGEGANEVRQHQQEEHMPMQPPDEELPTSPFASVGESSHAVRIFKCSINYATLCVSTCASLLASHPVS